MRRLWMTAASASPFSAYISLACVVVGAVLEGRKGEERMGGGERSRRRVKY